MSAPAARETPPAAPQAGWMAPQTLERRLMLRLFLAVLLAFLLFGAFYATFVQQDARGHVADRLTDQALDAAEGLAQGPQGWRLDPALLAQLAAQGVRLAARLEPAGTIVAGSDPQIAARLAELHPGTENFTEVTGQPGDPAQALSLLAGVRVRRDGQLFLIAAGGPASAGGLALSGLADEFSEEILPTFGPAMVLALLVAWLTIRGALRPLARASAEAAAVAAGTPGLRVSLEGLPGEVVPLVRAVNQAFAALEAAVAVESRFTADAAHQMRTPLAVLAARLEAMGEGPQIRALRGDVARLSRLLSQLLSAARLHAGEGRRLAPVDVPALSRDVLARLTPLALAAGRELSLEAQDGLMVQADYGLLESSLINLVENALRFAPPGSSVDVTLRPVGESVELAVRDHGPGVPAGEEERIFAPFYRAGGDGGGGAGLGLALVRDTAARLGGHAWVEPAAGGGARFVIALPVLRAGEARPQGQHGSTEQATAQHATAPDGSARAAAVAMAQPAG